MRTLKLDQPGRVDDEPAGYPQMGKDDWSIGDALQARRWPTGLCIDQQRCRLGQAEFHMQPTFERNLP
jgi:hypothetical protein